MIETPLIPPRGYSLGGCHIRASRYGERFPKAEDRIDIIPEREIDDLIAAGAGDLTRHLHKTFDQSSDPSCAMEATAQSGQVAASKEGEDFVLLNPLSGFAFTGSHNGSNIDDNLEHFRDVGLLPESVWPRSKGWRRKPPQDLIDNIACRFRADEWLDAASVDETRSLLLIHKPVVFGWKGHSCLLTKILDRYWAEYINSWGGMWNGNGRGKIRFSSINFGYGAWAPTSMVDPGDWKAEMQRIGHPLYDALGNPLANAV